MRRTLYLLLGLLVAPTLLWAQVEKQVEVTKAYEPTLEQATKLAIAPNMTDTTQLRPEIDYTITPLTLQTTLATRPIRPAQLTYWEFNRPRPFYLKAGVGVPLQSEVDLYAATQNPSTGYALAYLQHVGRFAKIENDFGVKRKAAEMQNRVGGAAGKYLGKHLLEADLGFAQRSAHRYGAHYPDQMLRPDDGVGYSTLDAAIRFGDDFQDLSRLNFELRIDGGLFFDQTDPIAAQQKAGEQEAAFQARMARQWGDKRFSIGASYHYYGGRKLFEKYNQHQTKVGARYGTSTEEFRYEVGLDYLFDRFNGYRFKSENYLFPYARFEFDLIADAVKPFAELDGALETNDYRSLSEENPWLDAPVWFDRSTVAWSARGGVTGHSKNNRFYYRAYAAATLRDNQRYWLLPALDPTAPKAYAAGWLTPYLSGQTTFSLGGEVEYRPLSSLLFDAEVAFHAYKDDVEIEHGRPSMEGSVGVRYEGRTIRCGARADFLGERSWSIFDPAGDTLIYERLVGSYDAPFTVDLSLDFEWLMRAHTALYLKANNLLSHDLYRLPTMPEYGANVMVGVRMAF